MTSATTKTADGSRSRKSFRLSQRRWTKKLKNARLSDLVRVDHLTGPTFATPCNVVQLVGHPNAAFVLKVYEKASLTSDEHQCILAEKTILNRVRSDFIIKLYRTFRDDKYLYFLTEYCPGGNLQNLVRLHEDAAKFYVASVVEALDCLHSDGISHNAIEPKNLVLDKDGYVRLTNFFWAERLERGETVDQIGCSRYYVAPEAIRPTGRDVAKDRAVDLWGLGLMLYKFLTGTTPLKRMDLAEIASRGIESVEFKKKFFTLEAADLVRKLCAFEPRKRLGYVNVDEIRRHRWFKNFDWDRLNNRSLTPPKVPNITRPSDTFNYLNKLYFSSFRCTSNRSGHPDSRRDSKNLDQSMEVCESDEWNDGRSEKSSDCD